MSRWGGGLDDAKALQDWILQAVSGGLFCMQTDRQQTHKRCMPGWVCVFWCRLQSVRVAGLW